MKKFLLILLSYCCSLCMFAQNEHEIQICNQAQQLYQLGRLDDAVHFLEGNMKNLSSLPKVTALRLLALCYLEQDQMDHAEQNVSLLLKEDPYYNISLNDPPRFVDMVAQLKRGESAVITTASQQAESIEEAPVPVTLITEEMITAIGARDLRDVLAAYVPGITIIEGYQHNIGMHGIYNATQDKILFMLNGHRLNSRCTNTEAPDFRNSLNKIKQIEVLRGPASSLYGNVALTAVVNIITKTGKDVDGVEVSYGMGDNSTFRSDVLFGKRLLNTDILVWGSVYSSQGEKRMITPDHKDFIGVIPIQGSMYLEGFNHKPAYDLGMIMQWNKLKFMFNQQYSKKVTPYTSAAVHPTIYDYDRYRLYNGMKPGHGRLTTRGEIAYADSKDNLSWNVNVFIDAESNNNYDVSGDTLTAEDSFFPIYGLHDEYLKDSFLIQTTGVYQILEWKDYSYGGNFSGNYQYKFKNKSHGNILLGAQIENYKMYDNSFVLGDKFNRVDITYSDENRRIELGNEVNFSVFTQLKHHFNEKLIFNGGLRFDYKHRFNDKNLRAYSPRLSLIYSFSPVWNMKLGYARSFVDAPFFYRANKTRRYKGSSDLKPEYMNAFQLSSTAFYKDLNLRFDCNLYYNKLNDLIFYDTGLHRYINAGKLDLLGLENVVSYQGRSFKAVWNMAYQHVLKAERYSVIGHQIRNVPSFTTNLSVMSRVLTYGRDHSVWLRGNLSCYTKQPSPISVHYGPDNFVDEPEAETKARAIVNIGAIYNWKKLAVSFQCYNLLNTHYGQGGSHFKYDIPQQGRSVMGVLSYAFN